MHERQKMQSRGTRPGHLKITKGNKERLAAKGWIAVGKRCRTHKAKNIIYHTEQHIKRATAPPFAVGCVTLRPRGDALEGGGPHSPSVRR